MILFLGKTITYYKISKNRTSIVAYDINSNPIPSANIWLGNEGRKNNSTNAIIEILINFIIMKQSTITILLKQYKLKDVLDHFIDFKPIHIEYILLKVS